MSVWYKSPNFDQMINCWILHDLWHKNIHVLAWLFGTIYIFRLTYRLSIFNCKLLVSSIPNRYSDAPKMYQSIQSTFAKWIISLTFSLFRFFHKKKLAFFSHLIPFTSQYLPFMDGAKTAVNKTIDVLNHLSILLSQSMFFFLLFR